MVFYILVLNILGWGGSRGGTKSSSKAWETSKKLSSRKGLKQSNWPCYAIREKNKSADLRLPAGRDKIRDSNRSTSDVPRRVHVLNQ